jgi:hypothetical protein
MKVSINSLPHHFPGDLIFHLAVLLDVDLAPPSLSFTDKPKPSTFSASGFKVKDSEARI